MEIVSKSNKKYFVKFHPSFLMYSDIIVSVKKKLLGFVYLKRVWRGSTEYKFIVKKMYPETLKCLFQEAVNEYEDYINAWVKEKKE